MGLLGPRTHALRDGTQVTVRSAQGADAGAVIEFLIPIFETADTVATGPGEFRLTVEQEREFILARLSSETDLCIIAESSSTVIGVLVFTAEPRRRLGHNVTLGISVGERWRGRGVGRSLMEEAIAWAEANPRIERVCLAVVAGNPGAVHLYESVGFVREGLRPAHFQRRPGVYDDEILMARRVKPLPSRRALS